MENLKLSNYFTTYTVNSQWIKNSNMEGKTFKLLEESIFMTQGVRGQKDFLKHRKYKPYRIALIGKLDC